MTGTGDPAPDADPLDVAFTETVRRTGACIGALYLLAPDERLLSLDLLCGLPAEFAAPWETVPLAAPAPVADSVRNHRMVWVGSQEDMARSYPRVAMALPYPLAMVAAPVTGVRMWGVPGADVAATRPPYMTRQEQGTVTSCCRSLARLLEETAERGRAPARREQPRVALAGTRPGSARPGDGRRRLRRAAARRKLRAGPGRTLHLPQLQRLRAARP
ncbi:hypothetical protein GCM10020295_75790 [Streptomyces cinereospinus]